MFQLWDIYGDCIPFIIDKNSNGVKSLADDYSILEALRIISAENNGFFGLGSKKI